LESEVEEEELNEIFNPGIRLAGSFEAFVGLQESHSLDPSRAIKLSSS